MQEKLKQKYGKYNNMLKALVFNAVALILYLLVFEPVFETNDDNYMAAIIYGASGESSSHLVFINIIIGKILSTLVKIIPFIPWYSVFQYAVMFASFTLISYIFLEKDKNNLAWIVNGIMLICFGYEAYVYVQFTKTAALAIIAGAVCLFFAFEKVGKQRVLYLGLAFAFVIMGSMIRFLVVFVAVVPLSCYGIYQLYNYLKKKKWKVLCVYLCSVATILLLCCCANMIDTYIYAADDEWNDYLQINAARSELLDYGFPNYEKNEKTYEDLEIDENALYMYENWDFADTEKFTLKTMEALAQAKGMGDSQNIWKSVKIYFQEVIPSFFEYKYFCAVLLMIILWIVYDRRNWIFVIYELLAVFVAEGYMFEQGRYLANRVDFGLLLSAFIVIALLIVQGITDRFKYREIGALIGAVVVLNLSSWTSDVLEMRSAVLKQEKQEAQGFYQLMSEDKEHIYFCSEYSHDAMWVSAYSVWDIVPKGIRANYYVTGGWSYGSPIVNKALLDYGISNPFSDMIDNSSAYFIDNNDVSTKVEYMRKYYNENAYANWAKYINGVAVYRIVTHEPEIDDNAVIQKNDALVENFDASVEDGVLAVEGYAYIEGNNSYEQQILVKLTNKENPDDVRYYYTCQLENESLLDQNQGRYSGFEVNIYNLEDPDTYNVEVIYVYDGEMYCAAD